MSDFALIVLFVFCLVQFREYRMIHAPQVRTCLKTFLAVVGILTGLGAALLPSAARAEYLLASGDVLDITVFRVPELSHELTVDVDGRIAFPPLGRIDVAGQTLDGVALRLRELLTRQEILSNPQVTVALATTRPVFIGGDVATPGAYPYQADLTVRRAMALAGGLGFARTRGAEEASRLRSERDTTAIDLLREQARLRRLEAEIAGREVFEAALPGHGVSQARQDEILALEARKLAANLAEAREEKAHLERGVALVDERIRTLADQRSLQEGLVAQQTGEIDRIREIQSRGLASQARVTEEQRVLDSMQERLAANETETAAAHESLEAVTYARDRFDDRRAAALGAEKQEALLAIEAGVAKLRATDQRLAELGASDLGQVRITIYGAGSGGAGAAGTPASFDTLLGPGDTLDITVEMDGYGPGTDPGTGSDGASDTGSGAGGATPAPDAAPVATGARP